MTSKSRPLPWLACALLAGCGGGGGGGEGGGVGGDGAQPGNPPPDDSPPPSVDLKGRTGILFSEAIRRELFIEIEELDGFVLSLGGGAAVPSFDLVNGREEKPCAIEGTSSADVQGQGATVTFEYSDCNEEDIELDGTITFRFSNVDASRSSFDFAMTYTDMRATIGAASQTLNGTMSVHTRSSGGVHTHEIVLDRTLEVWSASDLTAKALAATIAHPQYDHVKMAVTQTSGSFAISDIGQVDLDYLAATSEIHLIGAQASEVFVTLDGDTYSLRYMDEQGETRRVSVDAAHIPQLEVLDGRNSAPVLARFPNDLDLDVGEVVELDFSRDFFDPDLEEVEITLDVEEPPGSESIEITSVGEGVFEVKAVAGVELVLLRVTATDPQGAFESGTFRVVVLVDSDGDGVYDPHDSDDDNDGIPDENDAFPLDPSESDDFDHDGIGNGADTDDDGDGVLDGEDAFPLDSACGRADEGDGEQCFLSAIRGFDRVFADAGGIIYFAVHADKAVHRWDSNAESFLLPAWNLGTAVPSDSLVETSAYVASQGRVYFGYDNGAITYVDVLAGVEQPFASVPAAVTGLADAGKFVLAQDGTGAWGTHYVFADDGTLLASEDWNYYSRTYAYNPIEERVYFFRDDTSPNDLHYEQIDQATGQMVANGETPYHGAYSMMPPIVVSPNGDLILIGSGNLFNAGALTWAGAIPGGVVAAQWNLADGLMVLREQSGETLLERRDAALQVVERRVFDGLPRAIEKTATGYAVVTATADHVLIEPYQASDDTDGDGVLNTTDAFPLDPAASVDTDHDGHPDGWNAGASEADSTTGLVVDAYPNASACYLPEHGDGITCDVASTLPDYFPDVVMAGPGGVVFLLSAENHRVYRYSAAAGQHLSPIVVGTDAELNATAPTTMEYQPFHERLYLGYPSGAVTYVDLTDAQLQEQPFVTVAAAVNGLGAAGEFVLVQDDSGAWETHYYFDAAGVLRDSADWNRFSTDYEWNETLSRLFFFRDNTSPNDLHYEEIGADGTILSSGETPYHSAYMIIRPIVMSPDDQYVLLGSGDIYRSDDLTWHRSLLAGFVGAVWDDNGNIVTARDVGFTRIDRYDANQVWIGEADYDGVPLALIEHGGGYLLVAHDGLEPVFTPMPR